MTADTPLIRRLTVNDAETFCAIRQEALTETPAAFASTAEDFAALSKEAICRLLTDIALFAAMRDNKPVGLMGVTRHNASKMAHRGILVMVYLRKAERGNGLASALLAAIDAHARASGLHQLELAVSVENTAALAFYRREGFTEVGRIPAGFLHKGQAIDEILMIRRIA
nr:GNAT family N-acetyltransferase [uncultured Shinella sp.]